MSIPILQNQVPAPGAKHIAPSTNIYLELDEPDVGLDESSVVLTVNGVVAWTGDAQQTGFAVNKVSNPGSWTSRFSGLPTNVDAGAYGDSYAGGVFTISTNVNPRQWTGAGSSGDVAYETLAGMSADVSQVLRVSARYSAVSGGGDLGIAAGLYGPGEDDASLSKALYDGVNINATGLFIENGSSTEYIPVPQATTVPVQVRLYWNPTGSAFVIPDSGFSSWSVAANFQSVWCSFDDGTTWAHVADRAIDPGVVPTKAGVALIEDLPTGAGTDTVTISNMEVVEFEGGDASYDINPDTDFPLESTAAIGVYAEDTGGVPLDVSYYFDIASSITGTDVDTGAYEDRAEILTAGGPDKHVAPDVGVGQRIPGPPNQMVGSVGPFDEGAYEDDYNIPTAGGPIQHQAPVMDTEEGEFGVGQHVPGPAAQAALGRTGPDDQAAFEDELTLPTADGQPHHAFDDDTRVGVLMPGPPLQQLHGQQPAEQGGFEDRLIYELDADADIDYVASKQDTDGNDFLGGYTMNQVVLVDTTLGGFASPLGSGHHGGAKDGKYYYDGVECGPSSSFGTVAGGPNRTAWPMWSGIEPFGNNAPASTSVTIPSDGVVRFTGTALNGGESTAIRSLHGWVLQGDIDIQVDYTNWSYGGGGDGGCQMYARINAKNSWFVRRKGATDVYDRDVFRNGAWVGYASAPGLGHTSGKMRLTRVGTIVRSFYWTGSAWAQIGPDVDIYLTDPVCVQLGVWGTGALTCSIDFSNFTINSGTPSNRTGWYQEASGTHRGTQADMPNTLAVVCSVQSIDLIDVSNNKLWMRFLQGANNVFDNWDSRIEAIDATFQDGVLLIALSASRYGVDEGMLLVIDFTEDNVRVHRHAASTILGTYYADWISSVGGIALRNAARDWYATTYAEWALQDRKVQSCSVVADSGSMYRAAAVGSGVAAFKTQRWYRITALQHAFSTETTVMRFCRYNPANGNLFYVDATTLYEATKADVDAGLAGGFGNTFGATTTKTLPGTAAAPAHYRFHRYGSSMLYMPRVEGIYKVDWPSGSFIHEYGTAASSAVHGILPAHDALNDVTFAQDGATDLLLVDLLIDGATGLTQVVAIKLSDHSIYAVSKAFKKSLTATGMAA